MTELGQLHFLQAGPHTLLQDLGRREVQHLGFCQSGACDEHAFRWANSLLNNTQNSAALEITLGPFSCRFNGPTKIAITGAATTFIINKKEYASWRSVWVNNGDVLTIKTPQSGLKTYLAIQGGFLQKPIFNSLSMVSKEGTGPFNGQPLNKENMLHYHYVNHTTQKTSTCLHSKNGSEVIREDSSTRFIPAHFIPDYSSPLHVHIILNTKQNLFTPEELANFFATEFTVTNMISRMAYRLAPLIEEENKSIFSPEIPVEKNKSTTFYSQGAPFGTVQIPPNRHPIILLKDRQTIGGYPDIGCITHLDCFALSQRKPNQKVLFRPTSIQESQEKLRNFYNFFHTGISSTEK